MLEAFLSSTIGMAAPLLLAALGELLVEQSGVINIGIEGVMLTGAFAAMAAAYATGSPAIGLCAAVAAAIAMTAALGVMAINLAVNQVVAGTALDVFALGVTGVFYRRLFGITGRALTVNTLARVRLGPLARIPLLGPALFHQNVLVYFAFLLVPPVRSVAGPGLTAIAVRGLQRRVPVISYATAFRTESRRDYSGDGRDYIEGEVIDVRDVESPASPERFNGR